MRKITKNADYVFQQDGDPAHTAKVVQDWLGSNMNFWSKDFWLPQLPNLNPLDYSEWHISRTRLAKFTIAVSKS